MIFETQDSPFSHLEHREFVLPIWLENWYPLICDYLNIETKGDLLALREVLTHSISNITSQELYQKIKGKNILAVAPGVYLEKEFAHHMSLNEDTENVIICSDGATSYLISQNVVPDLIVTDLDGKIEDQLKAQKQGSIMLIHIHEDNLDTVKEHIPAFSTGNFVLTTQTQPLKGSYNFFGFTDGDRAVCLATYLTAESIKLVGYDFGKSVGKYSKTEVLDDKMLKRKMKKFTIAKSIINWCYHKNNQISRY